VADERLRKIIHVDMDAFFAAVEQRDNPALRGRPVIVGGAPQSRGVVSTCSYEARRFGVHSAMASSRAVRLCPQAVFLRPRFEAYMQVSAQIRAIFRDYTDLVEPLSLDEAFLDVTANFKRCGSATGMAREILSRIRKETGLTASAGVSYNKFLAKVASDYKKPNGLTVVRPEQARVFLKELPVRKFFGVGRVTERRMAKVGIRYGRDLLRFSLLELTEMFGKSGLFFYNIVRGEDYRPVEVSRERKSIGREHTYAEDLCSPEEMLHCLENICEQVAGHLQEEDKAGGTVTLKIKYHNFRSITRSVTPGQPVFKAAEIFSLIRPLFIKTAAGGGERVRLLGISLSKLVSPGEVKVQNQLELPFIFDK